MKILVIPDVQVKPEHDVSFLASIGAFIVDKKPDVIIQIGDFADMASLCSYDVGKKSFEGRRYKLDVEATHLAMETLLRPLHEYNEKARTTKTKIYKPRCILTLGNHEQRIVKAVEQDAKLEGILSLDDLGYSSKFGWEVIPFLQPIVVSGVAFCHYFISGQFGRPCTSAQSQLNKHHMSLVAGHQQGLQIATGHSADGRRLTSIIAGSCYTHDESYLNPQSNNHWRGILMLHEVDNGQFDLMPVSLKYLNDKYN